MWKLVEEGFCGSRDSKPQPGRNRPCHEPLKARPPRPAAHAPMLPFRDGAARPARPTTAAGMSSSAAVEPYESFQSLHERGLFAPQSLNAAASVVEWAPELSLGAGANMDASLTATSSHCCMPYEATSTGALVSVELTRPSACAIPVLGDLPMAHATPVLGDIPIAHASALAPYSHEILVANVPIAIPIASCVPSPLGGTSAISAPSTVAQASAASPRSAGDPVSAQAASRRRRRKRRSELQSLYRARSTQSVHTLAML